MNIKVRVINCYGPSVLGCKKHNAFAMIGVTVDNDNIVDPEFIDLFINDRESLIALRDTMTKILDNHDDKIEF